MSEALKARAGRAAAELVENGMRVGLGTGSTARHAILRLGERVATERLELNCIATSRATELLAREAGLRLSSFDEIEELDVCIDGADEVDAAHNLTKGGGGALLREKVVAAASRRFIVVVDPGKLVQRLGDSFPLPVEITPFALRPVARALAKLGGEPRLREREGSPFLTDNSNWILDVRFAGGIAEPGALERAIDALPGVVESGLFVGMATDLVVGRSEGCEQLRLR